ncbi:MAG TPA: hypothetical protein VNU48_10225 [Burkholderiaceae bacterium]|nr:hypothetical protein [Burkholderiaceae bacterium]
MKSARDSAARHRRNSEKSGGADGTMPHLPQVRAASISEIDARIEPHSESARAATVSLQF